MTVSRVGDSRGGCAGGVRGPRPGEPCEACEGRGYHYYLTCGHSGNGCDCAEAEERCERCGGTGRTEERMMDAEAQTMSDALDMTYEAMEKPRTRPVDWSGVAFLVALYLRDRTPMEAEIALREVAEDEDRIHDRADYLAAVDTIRRALNPRQDPVEQARTLEALRVRQGAKPTEAAA